MNHRLLQWLAIGATIVAMPIVRADNPMNYTPMFGVIGANNTMSFFGKHLYGQHRGAAGTEEKQASTVIAYHEPALAPAALAESYPPAQRDQAERSLRQVLQSYHELEDRLGVPRHDLAGAVAAYIAGNYMVLRDQTVPDEDFKAMVRQLRDIVATTPEFRSASPEDRQMLYEQLAIIGTSMAVAHQALQKKMDAATRAQAQRAARSYLERFLGVDPDRLQITRSGLTLV
jgi:hypothetical protein